MAEFSVIKISRIQEKNQSGMGGSDYLFWSAAGYFYQKKTRLR
jgi:hypothetical protein